MLLLSFGLLLITAVLGSLLAALHLRTEARRRDGYPARCMEFAG